MEISKILTSFKTFQNDLRAFESESNSHYIDLWNELGKSEIDIKQKFGNSKKSHIFFGEFSCIGRFDFEIGSVCNFIIQGFNYRLRLDKSLTSQIIESLYATYSIKKEDVLLSYCNVDSQKDIIEFYFAIQVDELFGSQDIKIFYNNRSFTGGYTYFDSVLLRGNSVVPDPKVYDFPLKSFSMPYNLNKETYTNCVENVLKNGQKDGILADMRSPGVYFNPEWTDRFKALKWQRIIEPTRRWTLQTNGKYI